MKPTKVCFLFFTLSAGLLAQYQPDKQIRIVVQNSSPGIPERSFAGKPKTIYRLGVRFARIEEDVNPETKLHLIIFTKAPDTWMVDLTNNSGRHMVDPSPVSKVVFPIFSKSNMPDSFPQEFAKLEYGKESEFFASYRTPFEAMKITNENMVKQTLIMEGWTLMLIRQNEKSNPRFLILIHDGSVFMSFDYLEYSYIVPPNMSIFDPPRDIKFIDTPPSP
jgi:hypothetical protein